MTHVSTKMKKHEVAIYESKHARGRHKGKGYTIATSVWFIIKYWDTMATYLAFNVCSW